MVVKMGRHVTSKIAFKSLAVGWVGPSLIIMLLCLQLKVCQSGRVYQKLISASFKKFGPIKWKSKSLTNSQKKIIKIESFRFLDEIDHSDHFVIFLEKTFWGAELQNPPLYGKFHSF